MSLRRYRARCSACSPSYHTKSCLVGHHSFISRWCIFERQQLGHGCDAMCGAELEGGPIAGIDEAGHTPPVSRPEHILEAVTCFLTS
jgi:hypothetical protein